MVVVVVLLLLLMMMMMLVMLVRRGGRGRGRGQGWSCRRREELGRELQYLLLPLAHLVKHGDRLPAPGPPRPGQACVDACGPWMWMCGWDA